VPLVTAAAAWVSSAPLARPAEAEDLARDVFVRLAGVPLEPRCSASPYILQVAPSFLLDRSRGREVRGDNASAQLAAVAAETLEPPAFDLEPLQPGRRSRGAL